MYFKVISFLEEKELTLGLNIRLFTENDRTTGFVIYEKDDVPCFVDVEYGNKLAFISLAKNSFVKKEDEHFTRTNKIYIEKIINIEDWEMWNDPIFCLEAAKRAWQALRFIKNQTIDMVYFALIQDGEEVEDQKLCPSEEIYVLASVKASFYKQPNKAASKSVCQCL